QFLVRLEGRLELRLCAREGEDLRLALVLALDESALLEALELAGEILVAVGPGARGVGGGDARRAAGLGDVIEDREPLSVSLMRGGVGVLDDLVQLGGHQPAGGGPRVAEDGDEVPRRDALGGEREVEAGLVWNVLRVVRAG